MPEHKGGKRGRKIGKGDRKMRRNRTYGSYAALIAFSQKRKVERAAKRKTRLAALAARRKCSLCDQAGFANKRQLLRHRKFSCRAAALAGA